MTAHHLGIDVGGTRIKWALVHREQVVAQGEAATSKVGGEALVHQIAGIVAEVGAGATAVGLALPATIDTATRALLLLPNIPGEWENYPIGERLEELTRKEFRVLNDARAFGYAEFHLGAARSVDDALFLTIGTGIGGALVRAGRLVVGDVDRIPEMGHVAVEMYGERCGCGATGCLETVASASAIVAHTVRALVTGQSSILAELCRGRVENLSAEIVCRAADEGDPWAIAAFQRAGTFIGMAAATCCVMLQTPAVIVGGGLAGAFQHLAPAIGAVIRERIAIAGDVSVLKAQLGSHAGSVGAALYAAHRTAPTETSRTPSSSPGKQGPP